VLLSGCVNELYVITDARVTAARRHVVSCLRHTRTKCTNTCNVYDVRTTNTHHSALFMELWPWRVKGRGICRVQTPLAIPPPPLNVDTTPENNSLPDTRAALPLIAIKAFDRLRINLTPRSRLNLTMYSRKFDLGA